MTNGKSSLVSPDAALYGFGRKGSQNISILQIFQPRHLIIGNNTHFHRFIIEVLHHQCFIVIHKQSDFGGEPPDRYPYPLLIMRRISFKAFAGKSYKFPISSGMVNTYRLPAA